jgi:hypothetical protein
MEKMMVLDAVYGVPQAWSSMQLVTLVSSWRKLLPDLEDEDLQGFHNEVISKSKILDMVCAMRSFENTNKNNTEEWLQSDACESDFQHMTDTDIVSAATKQKGKEEGGEDESEEEGENSECISHSMALQCADTLPDYMSQKGFKYSNIKASRKICTAMRRLNSSQ